MAGAGKGIMASSPKQQLMETGSEETILCRNLAPCTPWEHTLPEVSILQKRMWNAEKRYSLHREEGRRAGCTHTSLQAVWLQLAQWRRPLQETWECRIRTWILHSLGCL